MVCGSKEEKSRRFQEVVRKLYMVNRGRTRISGKSRSYEKG